MDTQSKTETSPQTVAVDVVTPTPSDPVAPAAPIIAPITMIPSKRFTLNRADMERWARNAAIFLAPAGLVFLTALQSGATLRAAVLALWVWLLSTATDLLRKFIANK